MHFFEFNGLISSGICWILTDNILEIGVQFNSWDTLLQQGLPPCTPDNTKEIIQGMADKFKILNTQTLVWPIALSLKYPKVVNKSNVRILVTRGVINNVIIDWQLFTRLC